MNNKIKKKHIKIFYFLLLLLAIIHAVFLNTNRIPVIDKVVIENMDENEIEFWKVISLLDSDYKGDDEMVIDKAVRYLSEKSNEDIYKFEETLSRLLYDLDGIEYAKNIGGDSYIDDKHFFSPDGFLYSRCVVVANGMDYYYHVLNNPKDMPKDLEFEIILYISHYAYELKNDDFLDYISKYSYETFSNRDKWIKDESE